MTNHTRTPHPLPHMYPQPHQINENADLLCHAWLAFSLTVKTTTEVNLANKNKYKNNIKINCFDFFFKVIVVFVVFRKCLKYNPLNLTVKEIAKNLKYLSSEIFMLAAVHFYKIVFQITVNCWSVQCTLYTVHL